MPVKKYTDIPGWFDFQEIYRDAVNAAPQSGACFVELGSFLGQSTAFMAQEIKASGKAITFYAVDLFDVGPNNDHTALLLPHGGNIFPLFQQNLDELCLIHLVEPMVSSTDDAAAFFREKAIAFDFVFVDANHSFPFVKADIKNYLPLVKPGGILAGHDIYMADVKRAVTQSLPSSRLKFTPSCWIYKK